MKNNNTKQLNFDISPILYSQVILNKGKFIKTLSAVYALNDLHSIKNRMVILKNIISYRRNDKEGLLNIGADGDTISLRKDILISELNQILESQILERAKYYLKGLTNSIRQTRTNRINDINILRSKEYNEIITDSLWILDKRYTSGAHLGWY